MGAAYRYVYRRRFDFLAAFVSAVMAGPDPAVAEGLSDRLQRGNHFAAAHDSVAFPVVGPQDRLVLLVADLQSKRLQKIGIKDADILSPSFSTDGKRLLFVRHPVGNRERELVECLTQSWTCKSVLKTENNIGSPVGLGDGRILFVASPYRIGADGQGRYSRYDFWLHAVGSGVRQLTNMQLYSLSSVSVTRDSVYFSAYGPNPAIAAIPKYDPDVAQQSDVFRLPFNAVDATIASPSQTLTPLFLAAGKARSPAVSWDGSTISFLRTRLGSGNYHYELVLRKDGEPGEKVFPPPGLGFSPPVVVDQTVYANGIGISGYSIVAISPGESARRILEISDAAIESAGLSELVIER